MENPFCVRIPAFSGGSTGAIVRSMPTPAATASAAARESPVIRIVSIPMRRSEATADRLTMANLEKAVFHSAEWFWRAAARRMTFVSDDHRFPTWIDTTHHAGRPTLIAFYNPLVTPGMSERSLDERATLALDVLRTMIPGAPDPVGVHMTDWTNDPLANGSYSYVPVGGGQVDMQLLGRPGSGGLFFAGEHTVPASFGTVHGAYESGRRAAAEVLAGVTPSGDAAG